MGTALALHLADTMNNASWFASEIGVADNQRRGREHAPAPLGIEKSEGGQNVGTDLQRDRPGKGRTYQGLDQRRRSRRPGPNTPSQRGSTPFHFQMGCGHAGRALAT